MSGRVSVVAGCPNDGKTTIVHRMGLNAIDYGFKTLFVDGEHMQEDIINRLYQKVIGTNKQLFDLVKYNKKWVKEPKYHILEQLEEWHKDKMYILSKNMLDITSLTSLFNLIETYVKQLGIDLIILDNLMSLVDDGDENLNRQQSLFMKKTTALAKNNNCHIVLVAHPNKTVTRGEEFDYYQIAGNSDIPNLADNVFCTWRDFDATEVSGHLAIKKNRDYGQLKKLDLFYQQEISSLLELDIDGTPHCKQIDWMNRGNQGCLQQSNKKL